MKWGKKRDKTLRATCVCLQMVSKCDICSICRRKHLHIYISYAFCPKLYSTTVSEICLAECNIECNMYFYFAYFTLFAFKFTLSHKIVFFSVWKVFLPIKHAKLLCEVPAHWTVKLGKNFLYMCGKSSWWLGALWESLKGFHVVCDVHFAWADRGSCSPSTRVKIFQPSP